MESIYAYFLFGHFINRGFLYGPICPIYGVGAVLLIANLERIKDRSNWVKFFTSMIVFSVFEFLTSWILEILFQQKWWDYSQYFLNIQGRICLSFSILWGVIGVIFANFIHPWIKKKTEKVLDKTSIKIQKILLYMCCIIFIIDEIFSCIKYVA